MITLPSNLVCHCPYPNVQHRLDCEWAKREQELWAVGIAEMELRLAWLRAR